MKVLPTSIRKLKPIYFLGAFVLLEVLAQTYGFYWQFPISASITYFLAGTGVALLPLWNWKALTSFPAYPRLKGLIIGLSILLILWCLWKSLALLSAAPLDFRRADMLPILETMARRSLSGEAIYAPIEAIWGGMRPIYLPAMWLPFVPAVWLDIDIRWMSILFIILSLLIILFDAIKKSNRPIDLFYLLAFVPIILLYYYIFGLYSTLITLSEEPVVIFFYVLLAWSIFRNWPVLTGLAIAFCLLSRYSLVFWVPMYLLYLYFYRSRQLAFRTSLALIASLILLLSIGQAWDQLNFFLQLQHSYLEELIDDSKSWSFIAQIEKNPGLVKFLPFEHIAFWHRLLIYGTVLIPIGCFFFFKTYRSQLDGRFFGLCSLKLCLVYFYNMLTIPYSYLFYPSTFLSLFILYAALAEKNKLRNFFGSVPVG